MAPSLDFVRQAALSVCARSSESTIHNWQWYDGYCDCHKLNCGPNGVIVGNWNDAPGDDTLRRVGDILERLGFTLEWGDTTIGCDSCNRLICTQPGWWGDYPHYHLFDGFALCESCIVGGQDTYEYLDDVATAGHVDNFDCDPSSVPYASWEPHWKPFPGEFELNSYDAYKLPQKIRKLLGCEQGDILVSLNALHFRRGGLLALIRYGVGNLQLWLEREYCVPRQVKWG